MIAPNAFASRHLGPRPSDVQEMLNTLGVKDLDQLMQETVPAGIRIRGGLAEAVLGQGQEEHQALAELRALASQNQVFKSYLGMGYSDCVVPAVIQRNVLENPRWYTQYTPYQAEIAQGRLEALLNFQTMVAELTGMEISNASLLDEATAAAEALHMALAIVGAQSPERRTFFVSEECHPQTLAVVRTRAEPLGVEVVCGSNAKFLASAADPSLIGAVFQYPGTDGRIPDLEALIRKTREQGAMSVVSADLLALTLLKAPGELGADIVVGSTQRFGVPMGFGGPHAAFLATQKRHQRQIPGRIVGVSKDVDGKPAIRLALQTREQHIRRDKATSNICTAQVLLAIMASLYAVYHGPEGLRAIAERVRGLALALRAGLNALGFKVEAAPIFDTVRVELNGQSQAEILDRAKAARINLRVLDSKTFAVALDETTRPEDVSTLLSVFAGEAKAKSVTLEKLLSQSQEPLPSSHQRESAYLTHPVFNRYRSETELLRYITQLQNRDLSLAQSMIPLGSCTMKLNATAEMVPVSWPEFGGIHPFAPSEQTKGYLEMISDLERMLCEVTGFAGVSLQPNAGSQGEYTGLLVIRKYHQARGQGHRNICLIPQSAHGTNPASAVMAGMKVVVVQCDSQGNVDVADLKAKAEEHSKDLSALMVTYPSTHGVFEEAIGEICKVIHEHGGQVYMDGANMNAQVGLTRPGDFGPDVCHLNLHKTFCIPHGGGGPGMGPIGVAKHLVSFLPGHPVVKMGGDQAVGAVSAAPWGSASILPIPYVYIKMMGGKMLKLATEVAILNANYMAEKLASHYPVLYRGSKGRVAHECIIDTRSFKASAGIEVEDIAKRLMDYGFHAPTVSFPVAGTMMIEPTESESKAEMDRFCEAMILIRQEIAEIEQGKMDRQNNPLKNAPHTAEQVVRDSWSRPYSRERAVYPVAWVRENKFWPAVGRIDNVYGERNLVCSCLPLEAYANG